MLFSIFTLLGLLIAVKAWPCVSPVGKSYSRENSDAVLQFSVELASFPINFDFRFYNGTTKARISYDSLSDIRPQALPGANITGDKAGNVVVTLNNVQREDAGVYILASAGFTKCNCLYILGTPKKPSVSISQTPSVGESVTLTCSSTSTTTPSNHSLSLKYDWRVNNTDNPGGIKYSYTSNRDKLTVNNIVKEDAFKQVTCTATEDVSGGYTSVRSDQISFDVYHGPDNIEFTPNDISYEKAENDSFNQVTCSASCHPGCSFTWTKVRRDTDVSSTAVLNLGRLDSSKAGIYICTATRTGGQPKSKSLTVNVIYGPKNMSFNPSTESYRLDENSTMAMITCSAECWECNYSWSGPNSFSSSDSRLNLGRLTRAMTGTYTCTARNIKRSQQTTQRKQLSIEVRYGPDSIKVTNEQLVYTVDENTAISSIKCEADCFPNCTYTWTKEGQSQPITSTGTLSLGQVQKSSAGNYICKATNRDTSSKWKEQTITINIRYGPYMSSTKLFPSTKNYTINERQNINNISCSADCYPECIYSWSKTRNGETVIFINGSSVLSLGSLQRDQAATYTCTAKNPGKAVSTVTTIQSQINVIYGPYFARINVTSPYYILEGGNVTIKCMSDCYPGCVYTWINEKSGSIVSSSSGILHIEDVTTDMTGDYKCISKNANDSYLKSTASSIYVDIKERTSVTSFFIGNNASQSIVSVDEQDVNIKFTCKITGDPAEKVSIKLNGQVLKEETNSNSLIYFRDTATCFDSGVYECEAISKQMEASSKNVTFFVVCSPRPLRKIQENITSPLNVPFTFAFEALAYPEPGPKGFEWYRLRGTRWSQILSNKDFQVSSSKVQSNLSIVSLSKSDLGQYRVTIENIIGVYHQYFFLSREDNTGPECNTDCSKENNSLTIGIVLGVICIILAIYALTITIILKRHVLGTGRPGSNKQTSDNVLENKYMESEAVGEGNTSQSTYTELGRMSREKDNHVYADIKRETHPF